MVMDRVKSRLASAYGSAQVRFKRYRRTFSISISSKYGGRAPLKKDERKIVCRHRHDLAQFKPVGRGLADEIVYVAHAPALIPAS